MRVGRPGANPRPRSLVTFLRYNQSSSGRHSCAKTDGQAGSGLASLLAHAAEAGTGRWTHHQHGGLAESPLVPLEELASNLAEWGEHAWSESVLGDDPRHEMHIDELLKRIEQKFHKRVKKTTLVGNLARKVKAGDTFERTAPNTFGLLAFHRDKQLKFGS